MTPQLFFLRPPWRPAYIWPSLWLWKDISLSWNLFSEWRTSEIIGRKRAGGFSIQCLGVWDHLCSSPSREFCSLSASHFQIISCWKLSIIKTPFSRKSTRTKVTLRWVEINQTCGWKSILFFFFVTFEGSRFRGGHHDKHQHQPGANPADGEGQSAFPSDWLHSPSNNQICRLQK